MAQISEEKLRGLVFGKGGATKKMAFYKDVNGNDLCVTRYIKRDDDRDIDKTVSESEMTMKVQAIPHVLSTEVVEDGKYVYFISRRLLGVKCFMEERLKTLRDSGKVEWLSEIITRVINVLRKVNRHGLIHGDARFENIFVDEEEQIHLIDFGASKFVSEGEVYETNVAYEYGNTYNHFKDQYTFIYSLCFVPPGLKGTEGEANASLISKVARGYMLHVMKCKFEDIERYRKLHDCQFYELCIDEMKNGEIGIAHLEESLG